MLIYMHSKHMSQRVFNFNWDYNLTKVINFHMIGWVFANNWDWTLIKAKKFNKN